MSSKDKLNRAFQKALKRFKPSGFMEEIAMGQAPSRFAQWIQSISDAEAEEIRKEMVFELL